MGSCQVKTLDRLFSGLQFNNTGLQFSTDSLLNHSHVAKIVPKVIQY